MDGTTRPDPCPPLPPHSPTGSPGPSSPPTPPWRSLERGHLTKQFLEIPPPAPFGVERPPRTGGRGHSRKMQREAGGVSKPPPTPQWCPPTSLNTSKAICWGRGGAEGGGCSLFQQHKAAPPHHPFTLPPPPTPKSIPVPCPTGPPPARPSWQQGPTAARQSSCSELPQHCREGLGCSALCPPEGAGGRAPGAVFQPPQGARLVPSSCGNAPPSPQQVFPSTPPQLCPPTVNAGCMGNTCPTSDLKHLPEIWEVGGGGGKEGHILGHPTPYTPRWGHPCVSVTISPRKGETEARSHPGVPIPSRAAKRDSLGAYGVEGGAVGTRCSSCLQGTRP